MSDWSLKSYSLNSKTYAPLETAILQNIVLLNKTTTPFQVTKVLLKFECQEGFQYSVKCNVQIDENKSAQLPIIEFNIPLAMPTGPQRYNVGVETKQFIGDKWERDESFGKKGKFIEIKPLQIQPQNYKIFISHSNSEQDKDLVEACREALVTCGLQGYFAEFDNQVGGILWDKIQREITLSDIFLVLWTKAGSKSGDVREEIGIALGREKRIIPVVQQGTKVYGSLKSRGIEWITYKPKNEINALSNALTIIMELAKKKEESKAVLEQIPAAKKVRFI